MQCCCDYVLYTRRKINFYSIHFNMFAIFSFVLNNKLCETLNHSFIILCLHCIVLYFSDHKTISFVNGQRQILMMFLK